MGSRTTYQAPGDAGREVKALVIEALANVPRVHPVYPQISLVDVHLTFVSVVDTGVRASEPCFFCAEQSWWDIPTICTTAYGAAMYDGFTPKTVLAAVDTSMLFFT